MLDNDYVMRMVQQFARFLARIVFHKDAGEHEQARSLIEDALRTLLGLDMELVDSMGDDELVRLVSTAGRPDGEVKEGIADLKRVTGA